MQKFSEWLELKEIAVKDSPIHGKGVFADQPYRADDIIGTALDKSHKIGGKTYYSRLPLGRFTNWSDTDERNIYIKKNDDDGWDMYAKKDIPIGTELLASREYVKEYKQLGDFAWEN